MNSSDPRNVAGHFGYRKNRCNSSTSVSQRHPGSTACKSRSECLPLLSTHALLLTFAAVITFSGELVTRHSGLKGTNVSRTRKGFRVFNCVSDEAHLCYRVKMRNSTRGLLPSVPNGTFESYPPPHTHTHRRESSHLRSMSVLFGGLTAHQMAMRVSLFKVATELHTPSTVTVPPS